jgi:tRNA1Val (adenine37-N6)-methyltransferase
VGWNLCLERMISNRPHLSQPAADLPPSAPVLTDDALTDRVRVWQRRSGHRYSVDDVTTAWVAIAARPSAATYLDLGCGIGSVLLMVADRLPEVRAVGIEAQAVSFALAQCNVERNALGRRVMLQRADIREPQLAECVRQVAPSGFDLVTGTPPYKPLGTATVSPDSQRAHARVELRGGVEAYLQAAARVLAASGLFVMCAEAALDTRVWQGARAAGLCIVARLDVIPIATHKGRLFSVYSCQRAVLQDAGDARPVSVSQLVLRDADGTRSAAARALRGFFGLSSDPREPSSPPRRQAPAPVLVRSHTS